MGRGAWQVVQFNWPQVVAGVAVAAGGILGWRRLGWSGRLAGVVAGFWTVSSIAASWWVYDLSPLRRWQFVDGVVPDAVRSGQSPTVLVVAGFDEVSGPLQKALPQATITVIDVVTDPGVSVRRARRFYPAAVPVIDPTRIVDHGPAGLVFFAQSAHEIRDFRQRVAMFRSAAAAVGSDGRIVVVEHVRDLSNLVAFGPGAFHFHSGASWRKTFQGSNLEIIEHQTITPLVHCWLLQPHGGWHAS